MKKVKMWGIMLLVFLGHNVMAQEKMLSFLKGQLNMQMTELQTKDLPPYYMSYRMAERELTQIEASFGSLMPGAFVKSRQIVPHIRVGDKTNDNFLLVDFGTQKPQPIQVSIENDNYQAQIAEKLWIESSLRYQYAVDQYKAVKMDQMVNGTISDRAGSWTDTEPVEYYEKPLTTYEKHIDIKAWENALKEVSAVFSEYPDLLSSSVSLSHDVIRKYFIDTEGSSVVQNLIYVRVMLNCGSKADDGMDLNLMDDYFAHSLEKLPEVDEMKAKAHELAQKIIRLKKAPLVDPYTGPVLLSGKAAGVFFHEIFGHRIEGQRMKKDADGQTFKNMVGQKVLPETFNVYDDPSRKEYNGIDLNGYYKYDDQGVLGSAVEVVKNGELHEFLMSRTPIDNFYKSNGHGRGGSYYDATSRQSNLIIESEEGLTETQMRDLLIKELKAQNKEFGFYFANVTSGLTFTDTKSINSFNVTPTEVYQVFTDGRPDRLVRGVDLIGTPLSMFSNITNGGGENEVFTGICGAESGWVPVTAIAPTILCKKVEMQRSAKAQSMLPILENPVK